MRAEIEVIEEPRGVFTFSVGKMDMIVVEDCGVKIVAPRNVIFGTDLLWLLKASCNISTFLLMKRISTLEEVRAHIKIHEKLWEME